MAGPVKNVTLGEYDGTEKKEPTLRPSEEVQADPTPVSVKEKRQVETVEVRGKLPSGSKTYPSGYKIFYKTYSFSEIRKFSGNKLSFEENCKLVMEGVTTEGFDKWDITFYDFLYISLLRKLSTLRSPKFKILYICSQCGKNTSAVFSLEEVDFDELSVELPINYVTDDVTYTFMPLTIGNYLRLVNPEDASSRLAICCTSHQFMDAYKMISEEGDIENLSLFTEIEDHLYHGLKPFKFTCRERIGEEDKEAKKASVEKRELYKDPRPFCNKEYESELDGGELLIIPFRESEGTGGNRICFGKTEGN